VKFALIAAEKAAFPIGFMCEQLGVSRSGYYAWQGRAPSPRAVANTALGTAVAAIYETTRGRYGSPRIVHELAAQGRGTSRKRVARLMREQGLVARRRPRCRRTTDSNHPFPIATNVLAGQFTARAPNQIWVTDLTYIWTRQGWLYLSAILDLYSRAVVGWAMSDRTTPSSASRRWRWPCTAGARPPAWYITPIAAVSTRASSTGPRSRSTE
jgi:putative transposase